MQTKRGMLYYGALAAMLLGIEIYIGCCVGGWVRAYVGDVLVMPLLYCCIRFFTRKLPVLLPFLVFGIGAAAELLQLWHLSDRLGFERGSLPSILLGTSASWWDIVSYGVGILLIFAGMLLRLKIWKTVKENRYE